MLPIMDSEIGTEVPGPWNLRDVPTVYALSI
jgi:hypothetical protein